MRFSQYKRVVKQTVSSTLLRAVASLFLAAIAMSMSATAATLDVVISAPAAHSTGTYHYVDALRLSVHGATPLILESDVEHDHLVPIPGPQYAIGDDRVLLLGWSSFGSGMQTIHALLLRIEKDAVSLQQELVYTTDRNHAALLVRRNGPKASCSGFPSCQKARTRKTSGP